MKFSAIKQQRIWWTISLLIILAGVAAMVVSFSQFQAPLRPGLDFIGGTRLQLELDCSVAGNCDRPIDSAKVRAILSEQDLGDSSIQVIENYGLSIRSKTLNVDQRTQLEASLNQQIGKFDPQKTQIDTVGPTIGRELFVSGMLALIVSFFGILVYLSVRFQFDCAFFAFIALFHDVLVTAGIFSILGLVAGVEVDSLFLVSLLTIIGFSVNDTVVIYDRIRDNLVQFPDLSINETVDNAVNQTLGRSINTTLTTLLPLVAIFFLGGETLKYFALALIVGFIAGAYSSIFIASTLLAWWRNRQPKSAVAKSGS
ncbi:MAG: protein translocase subunit SecF [Hydrococcus sp. C42_A2020_068]|uniref:protein translocase subunit SecF n=1 Tax=Pleurocapsa sp. PCC 7327 TaxID=118163 RepID=UPI00029F8B0F|nr:protein translocase subunit SecF [Pleurocapsa sp. PCC 7327]AFY75578.1 protein-export membrane protein, SecD/SecF family [Pleurocapsa sp. PCC 7327]MBF2022070.1 protein translocase subunit SecF [Hydrococcus sp. C42_A2020_068]